MSAFPASSIGLRGLVVAPVTPFTAAGGVDLDAIAPLCRHCLAQGVSGLFVCGTTGEGVSLALAEREAVAEAWLAAAPAGVPVLVHAGALALPDAHRLAAHAERHRAAGVAVLAPCFLRPADAAGVVDWIAAVAEACPRTPVTYYHIPALTGVAVRVREVVALALERVPNFAGIKFTHEDLHDYAACLARWDGRLDLAFGRDEMLLAALALGARSAVGSTWQVAGRLGGRILAAHAAGDAAAARAAQGTLGALIEVLARHRFLPALRELLALQGVPCGPCRAPLRPLDDGERRRLRADLLALDGAADLALAA